MGRECFRKYTLSRSSSAYSLRSGNGVDMYVYLERNGKKDHASFEGIRAGLEDGKPFCFTSLLN